MFFTPDKEKCSTGLFNFLTDSSLADGATVRIYAVHGDAQMSIDPLAVRAGRWRDEVKNLLPSDPAAPPDLHRLHFRSGAMRVLVSDLLFSADPNPYFRILGQKQGSPIIFSPFLKTEADPDWAGNYDFIDAELQSTHPHRIEAATLRRYRESYKAHFDQWKESALRHQTPLARIPCEEDLMPALYQHALPVRALEASK